MGLALATEGLESTIVGLALATDRLEPAVVGPPATTSIMACSARLSNDCYSSSSSSNITGLLLDVLVGTSGLRFFPLGLAIDVESP